MKIRKMTIDDYEEVFAVWQAAGLDLAALDDSKPEIGRILTMNPTTCFVAEDQGKIVATVLGTFNGRRAWAHHLAVLPEYQGKGLGKTLMLKLEKQCLALGAIKLQLGVASSNLAVIPFYKKLGFSPVKHAVWLSKTLRS
ncbi:MAG: GNAT family N-acetyltransferase [Candidatus Chisholmbacteria bacterium]|nr:GNAT family N-acetyltransferase [Candidatus Chisholmbacteria bacterium]